MNKKGFLKLVDLELKSRNHPSLNWDREFILNLYRRLKKENLTHDEIVRRIVSGFEGFDEDYWKQKIERVLRSERLIDNDAAQENSNEKNFNIENLLSKDIAINQKEELIIGKIVKVNDKIGIVAKIIRAGN